MSKATALEIWTLLKDASRMPQDARGSEFSRIYSAYRVPFMYQAIFAGMLNGLSKVRIAA